MANKRIRTTVYGTTAPLDRNVAWIDTTDASNSVLKLYVNGEWQAVPGGSGPEPVESTANKVTEISSESTDEQYPSAKAVNTAIENITIPVLDVTNWDFTQDIKILDEHEVEALLDAIFVKVLFSDGPLLLMRDNSALARTLVEYQNLESVIFTRGLATDDYVTASVGYYLDVCIDPTIHIARRGEV